ncbi:MAG: zf-HC2 domain-containing protein [Phycisphaerae bacterium]|jgi:hypothetical protein
MTCPANEDLVRFDMGVLDEKALRAVREHLQVCSACRRRVSAFGQQHLELTRAYEALDRDRDARREQLMTSLPASRPIAGRQVWSRHGVRWLGDLVMQHPKTRRAAGLLATAAAIVIVFLLFADGTDSVAFADVLERLRSVETIVCRLQGGSPGLSGEGKLYLSSEHGGRGEMEVADGRRFTWFSPIGGPNTVINWQDGTYMVLQIDNDETTEALFNPPEAWLSRLRELTEDPDKYLGRRKLEGREVEGFEIAGAKLGVYTPGVVARLWVDPETRLPVKFEGAGEPGSDWHATYDRFRFDVPFGPDTFRVDIPDDFVMLGQPSADEQTMLKGLRYFAEYAGGRYPSSMDPEGMPAEFGRLVRAKVDRQGGPPDPSDPAFQRTGAKVLHVQTAAEFYGMLREEGREPEYFGDSVTPGDANAVLIRWRLDGARVRVIYGDLRAETVRD